jgi:hypothetical protein
LNVKTLTANYLATISWRNGQIIDSASAGRQYSLNGVINQLYKYSYAFKFDGAITSADGIYAFIYHRLGTKGLLLKNGELLREINRSYYCANSYEYPAAFVQLKNATYLIHCPIAYNQLDFENVETGELVTNKARRKPADIFHSRLEVSPGNTFLMSKGWVWHPLHSINIFDIAECIKKPKLLDQIGLTPNVDAEVNTASFIDDKKIIIGSSDEIMDEERTPIFPPKHLAVWDLESNQVSNPVKVDSDFGNLFAIDEMLSWDLLGFPKIINNNSGEIVAKEETINSGKQQSAFMTNDSKFPQIVFNRDTKQIAISGDEKIHILTP